MLYIGTGMLLVAFIVLLVYIEKRWKELYGVIGAVGNMLWTGFLCGLGLWLLGGAVHLVIYLVRGII